MAGVLPYAFFNNTIYFLVGKEHKEAGWNGSDKFSDFGGAIEAKHSETKILKEFETTLSHENVARVTAAIEFWEETMGLFYDAKEIHKMLSDPQSIVINNTIGNGKYTGHLMKVDYNPYWVDLFRNAYNYVLSCAVPNPNKQGMMYIPSCPDGYTEKTEIQWISYTDLLAEINANSPKYRPEFMATCRLLFALTTFKELLTQASIFKNPSTIGFVAPIIALPILPTQTPKAEPDYQWPAFYPKNKKNITTPGLINSLKTQYQNLLSSVPGIIVTDPKYVKMFEYIDIINQIHYEIKSFIYVKTAAGNSEDDTPIINMAYWSSKYCPLDDKNLLWNQLGSGAYGITYSMTGKVTKCCPPKPIRFVVKSVNSTTSGIDENQLKNISLDGFSPVTFNTGLKITDIFATEAASMSATNYLVTKSICYNFPYFYGVAHCSSNNTYYMYMQKIQQSLTQQQQVMISTFNGNDIVSLVLQGIMSIYAMYKLKLVHGDINPDNLAINTSDSPRHVVYKSGSSYYMGPKTNKILYFIDFGMGFIKDKLEPEFRVGKDKSRTNNQMNWSPTKLESYSEKNSHEAYKGYYVPKSSNTQERDAAYLRRHLLDLFLLFCTFYGTFGNMNMSKFDPIKQYIFGIFYNTSYYIQPSNFPNTGITDIPELVNYIWNKIFDKLKPFLSDFKTAKPEELMFLGNLDIPL